jgi:hypothetical protein
MLNYCDQFNIRFHYMFRCVFSVTKVRNSRTGGTGIISRKTHHAVANKLEIFLSPWRLKTGDDHVALLFVAAISKAFTHECDSQVRGGAILHRRFMNRIC